MGGGGTILQNYSLKCKHGTSITLYTVIAPRVALVRNQPLVGFLSCEEKYWGVGTDWAVLHHWNCFHLIGKSLF